MKDGLTGVFGVNSVQNSPAHSVNHGRVSSHDGGERGLIAGLDISGQQHTIAESGFGLCRAHYSGQYRRRPTCHDMFPLQLPNRPQVYHVRRLPDGRTI